MDTAESLLDVDHGALEQRAWLSRVEAMLEAEDVDSGYFERLGSRHAAAFFEQGATLLVTFESLQGIGALSPRAQPLGWEMVRSHGWSHLCLLCDGDSWFRDPRVYAYFDRLIDDGFFEDFERVVFYGAGPCGYAAAAFSVAAPGARVQAIQPQATLDPRVTEWDDRFAEMRRTSFTDRYGYAPDMLDAAGRAHVIYDPYERLDAMHAALFTRANVSKFRTPFLGAAVQTSLMRMDVLGALIAAAAGDRLDAAAFATLWRARRTHNPYLRNLLQHLDAQERPALAAMLCRNVLARIDSAPRFRKRLRALERAEAERV